MPFHSYADLVAAARRSIVELDVDELAALQEPQSDAPDLVVVDIREPEERARGFVPGSIGIARGMLEAGIEKHVFQGKVADTDLCKPIILYCAAGNRSALAALTLQQMGFTNVQSLAGGFHAWGQSGRPIEHPRAMS